MAWYMYLLGVIGCLLFLELSLRVYSKLLKSYAFLNMQDQIDDLRNRIVCLEYDISIHEDMIQELQDIPYTKYATKIQEATKPAKKARRK